MVPTFGCFVHFGYQCPARCILCTVLSLDFHLHFKVPELLFPLFAFALSFETGSLGWPPFAMHPRLLLNLWLCCRCPSSPGFLQICTYNLLQILYSVVATFAPSQGQLLLISHCQDSWLLLLSSPKHHSVHLGQRSGSCQHQFVLISTLGAPPLETVKVHILLPVQCEVTIPNTGL